MRRQVSDRSNFAVTEQHVQQSLVAADPQMYPAPSNATIEQLVRVEPGEYMSTRSHQRPQIEDQASLFESVVDITDKPIGITSTQILLG